MNDVIVLGAGLAGLGCALHLPGCRVFEAASHPGGRAYSHPVGRVHFDQGAHISHSRDEGFVRRITAAAGDVVTIEPSVVRNRWGGRWIGYPVQNHLADLPVSDRAQALTDLVESQASPPADDAADYRAWCLAQYGTFLTRNFYDVFTAKYWRMPAAELATDWLGGRLLPSQLPRIIRGAFGLPVESQSVFARFRYPAHGGFFGFFEPLYRDLPIHYEEQAVKIDARQKRVMFASGRVEGYETLVSTIPLPKLVALTKDAPCEITAAAAQLRHTQLLCVNLIVDLPRLTDCHWFYVYDQEVEFSRVSVPSNLSPGSLPVGRTALQAEIFRRCDEPLDQAALAEQAVVQLGAMLGFSPGEVRDAEHVLVSHAYVISDHARAESVRAIRSWLSERGILTAGLYGRWKYIWSDEAFRQGCEIANEILAHRGLVARAG